MSWALFDGAEFAPKITVEVAWAVDPNTGGGSGFVLDGSQLGTGQLGSAEFFTDITDDVTTIQIRRGRSKEFNTIEPGVAEIVMDNASGDYDPTNTAGRFAVGGITQVLPMRNIRVLAEWDGVAYYLFRGYVEDFDIDMSERPTTTLRCVDALGLLAQADIPAIASNYSGDLTGTRIGRILTAASFPTSLRTLDAGKSSMPATTYGDKALTLLNKCAQAEAGVIFADRKGYFTFLDRHYKYEAMSAADYTTIDLTDGVGANYSDLKVAYGASQVANAITGNLSGGSDSTVTDAASIAAYGRRSAPDVDLSDIEMIGTINDYLNFILFKFNDPDLRVEGVTLNCIGMADQWTSILDLDLQSLINLSRTYADHLFQRDLCVEGIQISISPNPASWTVTLSTSALDRQGYAALGEFVLGTSQLAF